MSETFIYQTYLNDITLCDDIISFFNGFPFKLPGRAGNTVDIETKKSLDCPLNANEKLYQKYVSELQRIMLEHAKVYPDSAINYWTIKETINIQRYLPNEGYFQYHHERTSFKNQTERFFVFMTYLNDVTDAGETEFKYQKLKVQPKKGLTLIWPAEWTHTHRGITSPTQEKFIVTGWMSMDSV